ncbi:MAG: Gfo/Idh/MocA family oxidoreductase [Gammaproteobacteria bacterium]|nr:Gfo/Idh/MocA family oxidoreductase [Gammaproteobacteria bacterium]
MSADIRVGVIGVGYLGRIHAKIYAKLPGIELVGVADVDEAAAKAIADELGCEAFTNGQDLIGKVDAVSIVVPTIYHLETAKPFIENGIHIMMEKPITPTYEDSLILVEMAEKAGIIFQVGFLERFNAGIMALANRCKNPRFIEAHRLSMFVERATDVDVITDLMIHDIDIVLSLVDSEIVNVSASGLPVLTEHVDIANVRLEFANGAVANVTASRVSNKKHRRIRVFEKDHYYGLNFEDQQLEIASTRPQHDNARDEIIMEKPQIEPQMPLDAELIEFIDSVKTGKPPLVDGRVGLEAIRVANLVRQSILDSVKK